MTDRTPTGDTTRSPQESERSRQGRTSERSGSSERQGSSPQRSGSSERQGSSRQGSTERSRQSRTSGTNRDFDESGESINQGHGHPREERGSRS